MADRSHWEADANAASCRKCNAQFALTLRRHHCRDCGKVFCDECCFFRAPGKKVNTPDRLCEACALSAACARLGVDLDEDQLEHLEEVEVGTNAEETIENKVIGTAASHHALTGAANAKINVRNCIVYGVKKGSNGHLHMEHCIVRGDEALEISGNNKVELKHCIILGVETGIELSSNASIEAKDCFIGASGKPNHDSTAVELSGNSKASFHDCTVCGKDGITTRANASVKLHDGSVSSQAAAIAFIDSRVAIAGKREVHGTKIIGKVADKAGQKSGMQKLGDKKKAQMKSKAKNAI
eukprot:CAMPEP_0114616758 /NCGR_PEP_ID=MMETSP0168-20121206/6851_1 /TAXON_ID=95228 ORGANISM="Vannella sp., Strain DIVA3 517/6/12" /NCGR_SAMPLE_ID=MMETSP0168 /ASSEMBLY_ACC=CAM_ASM_000044 /LENGTH=296 /DNA_ID=CAMNT_0001827881 /DNA_START=15 /DNA_END=905 /DNA_ORIENTATION=+